MNQHLKQSPKLKPFQSHANIVIINALKNTNPKLALKKNQQPTAQFFCLWADFCDLKKILVIIKLVHVL